MGRGSFLPNDRLHKNSYTLRYGVVFLKGCSLPKVARGAPLILPLFKRRRYEEHPHLGFLRLASLSAPENALNPAVNRCGCGDMSQGLLCQAL